MLEVAGETAFPADSGEGALDDPTLGQHDEEVKVAALDDLQVPAAGFGDGAGRDRDALAGVERGRGWSRAAGYLVSEASTITGGGLERGRSSAIQISGHLE